MMNAAYMLVGAALVIAGVLASALADRIRGIRAQRSREFWREVAAEPRKPRAERSEPRAETEPALKRQPPPVINGLDQTVIKALAGAGFTKPEAVAAVAACTASERTSLPEFTRAALQRAREAR